MTARFVSRRARALLSLSVMMCAVAALVAAPAAVGTSTAQAALLPGICGAADDAPPVRIISGWSPPLGALSAEEYIGKDEYGATAYEWWGGQSLDFTTNTIIDDNWAAQDARENCGMLNAFTGVGQSGVYGALWTMASGLNSLLMWAYQSAQSQQMFTTMTDSFIAPIMEGTQSSANPEGAPGFATIYRTIVPAILVMGGLYAGYRVLRGGVKEGFVAVGWQVAMLSVGLVLAFNPGFLPDQISRLAADGTGAVNEVATSAAKSLGAGSSITEQYCDLDVPTYEAVDGRAEVGTRESTCRMWALTYLQPYVTGQFGTTLPVATDSMQPDGNVYEDEAAGKYRWNAKESNKNLAVVIPGLKVQPEAGSLLPLQLSALYINPLEQRWINDQIAGKGYAQQRVDTAALLQRLVAGPPNAPDSSIYPVSEVGNACPAAGECIVNTGHQNVWNNLRNRATESQQPGVALTWSGTSAEGASARLNALVNMSIGTLAAGSAAGFFGLASMWYQLMLGLMLAFIGFAMLAMLFPGYGVQVARDFFSKIIRNLIMWILATGFMTLSVAMVMYVPDLILPDVSTSNPLMVATSATQVLIRFLLAGAVSALMIVMWARVRKAMSTKTFIKGARADSAWDVGGAAAGTVGKAAGAVAVTGAMVGAAVVTSGVTGAIAAGTKLGTAGGGAKTGGGVTGGEMGAAVGGGTVAAGVTSSAVAQAGDGLAGVQVPGTVNAAGAAVGAAAGGTGTTAGAAGAAAGASFASRFGQEFSKSLRGIGTSMFASVIGGGGLGGVQHQARNALTEAVTGVQTRAVTQDKSGRQTIIESGADARGAAAAPPLSPQVAAVMQNVQNVAVHTHEHVTNSGLIIPGGLEGSGQGGGRTVITPSRVDDAGVEDGPKRYARRSGFDMPSSLRD